MRYPWIRRLSATAGCLAAVALTAGTAPTAPTDPLPDATTPKLIEAEIAFLKKGFEKDLKKEKSAVAGLRAAALNVALYGSGDLRAQALKVAAALEKKDYAGGKEAAAKLTAAAGTPGDPAALIKSSNLTIAEVMTPYKTEKLGGLNIEADIRKQGKKLTDAKAVELIAARTVALSEFTMLLPNDKGGSNPGNQKKWDSYSKGILKASKDLLAEAAKGDKADKLKLEKGLRNVEATCNACHETFKN